MLILSRKVGEKLIADTGDHIIEFMILGINGSQIKVGIVAPKDVTIDREEIYKKRISGDWKND
jgi:carbon storage regulator